MEVNLHKNKSILAS